MILVNSKKIYIFTIILTLLMQIRFDYSSALTAHMVEFADGEVMPVSSYAAELEKQELYFVKNENKDTIFGEEEIINICKNDKKNRVGREKIERDCSSLEMDWEGEITEQGWLITVTVTNPTDKYMMIFLNFLTGDVVQYSLKPWDKNKYVRKAARYKMTVGPSKTCQKDYLVRSEKEFATVEFESCEDMRNMFEEKEFESILDQIENQLCRQPYNGIK